MNEISKLTSELTSFYVNEEDQAKKIDFPLFYSLIDDTKKVLTLDYENPDYTKDDVTELLDKISKKLSMVLDLYQAPEPTKLHDFFLDSLPKQRELLNGSIEAILNGDPASDSKREIVLCYPGFRAILSYRIAHLLYEMNLKLLARTVSENVHRSTGIDINPGAQIGKNFFIDHGTGIVVGETAIIGDNVKLYQGVTLGALSLSRGRLLKGLKRHPTVEDNVTIYSNAAIFGGDTIIGKGSTIGAVVYLTHSVPPNSIVYLGNSGIRTIEKVKNPV